MNSCRPDRLSNTDATIFLLNNVSIFIFDLTNSGVVRILIWQWAKTIKFMDNSNKDLVLLEQKVSELIAFCQQLKDENSKLKQKITDSEVEREQLLNNNEVASEQVRAAIEKLQSLGNID